MLKKSFIFIVPFTLFATESTVITSPVQKSKDVKLDYLHAKSMEKTIPHNQPIKKIKVTTKPKVRIYGTKKNPKCEEKIK